MASSSTGFDPSRTQWRYDVFISFRGVDTRKTFVDHLYTALVRKGIYPYKDDVTLDRGKPIAPELLQSIDDSRFAIVVFSKNYGNSSWCLDELVQIMECMRSKSRIVVPVFYDVVPSDVRKQKGEFGEAFAQNKSERVEVWQAALSEASYLSGWEPKNMANGHEAQCIEEIVNWLSIKLQDQRSGVDNSLTGMEFRMQQVEPLLGIGLGGVRMIGICGMGGAGKTSLARAIFDKYCNDFENFIFAESVREVSQKFGLQHVQKQILSMVDLEVNSVSGGAKLISQRLCRKKVLIVLDDVDHLNQLEAIAGTHSWFGEGSRIIITTRDSQLLVAHRVDNIHSVILLNETEAIMLFCKHAFREKAPPKGYEALSEQVIRYASGLPLTLKVLGSFLCGKGDKIWESALDKLKKVPENETVKILEISFDSLDHLQKEMFLDIACFYRGMDIYQVSLMLNSCGYYAASDLKVLEQKSLITVSSEKRCEVHDLLEEMALNIVRMEHLRKPWKRSRLKCPEEVLDILKNNKGTKKIKTMIVNMAGREDEENICEAFNKMKNLRLLRVSNASKLTFTGPIYLSEELRMLDFEDYPLEYLPKTFVGINLVRLVLTGRHIRGLWMENIKVSQKLKFLIIEYSEKLETTPDFTFMPNLEGVAFRRCPNLVEVHSSIGLLKNLKFLELNECRGLTKFPSSLGNLDSLEELSLSGCSEIECLPDSICQLSCLRILKLHNCLSIKRLPSDLGSMKCLEELLIFGSNIELLPDSICLLKRLRTVGLVACYKLKTLPADLGSIRGLELLDMRYSDILEVLPNIRSRLKSLKRQDYKGLTKVKRIPQMPAIASMNMLSIANKFIRASSVYDKMSPNIRNLK